MNFDRERIERMRQSKLVQPSICVERIKYMTESYRSTEGEPEVIRRAKAFLHELEHISVIIYPDDLIVAPFTPDGRRPVLPKHSNMMV